MTGSRPTGRRRSIRPWRCIAAAAAELAPPGGWPGGVRRRWRRRRAWGSAALALGHLALPASDVRGPKDPTCHLRGWPAFASAAAELAQAARRGLDRGPQLRHHRRTGRRRRPGPVVEIVERDRYPAGDASWRADLSGRAWWWTSTAVSTPPCSPAASPASRRSARSSAAKAPAARNATPPSWSPDPGATFWRKAAGLGPRRRRRAPSAEAGATPRKRRSLSAVQDRGPSSARPFKVNKDVISKPGGNEQDVIQHLRPAWRYPQGR